MNQWKLKGCVIALKHAVISLHKWLNERQRCFYMYFPSIREAHICLSLILDFHVAIWGSCQQFIEKAIKLVGCTDYLNDSTKNIQILFWLSNNEMSHRHDLLNNFSSINNASAQKLKQWHAAIIRKLIRPLWMVWVIHIIFCQCYCHINLFEINSSTVFSAVTIMW